jgi:hypothetical protein
MPQLQIDILVKKLRLHATELHDIYVAEKDIELSQRILDEVYVIENLIRSLVLYFSQRIVIYPLD